MLCMLEKKNVEVQLRNIKIIKKKIMQKLNQKISQLTFNIDSKLGRNFE